MKDNSINPEVEKLIKNWTETLTKYYGLSQNGLTSIANYGWYIDARITLGHANDLMERAINGEVQFLDNYFSKYYGENMEHLAESITKRQNSREKIVMEGVQCHNEGKYYASTILFLSQADGTCNGQLFRTKKEKESLKKYLAKTESRSFNNILFQMITSENTIDEGYSKKEKNGNSLNRHSVVHGLDVDFGTRINSLKAFSLLTFVTDWVDRYKKL